MDVEDDLELGESCGQARLRGRANMPTCDSAGVEGMEWAGPGLDETDILQQVNLSKLLSRVLKSTPVTGTSVLTNSVNHAHSL